MKPIKIRMNDKFLEKMKQYPKEDGWIIDWRSPTGCSFQDIYWYGSRNWLEMKPEVIYNFYKENPNHRVKLALVSNNLKSYSTCKIKNIYAEVWK